MQVHSLTTCTHFTCSQVHSKGEMIYHSCFASLQLSCLLENQPQDTSSRPGSCKKTIKGFWNITEAAMPILCIASSAVEGMNDWQGHRLSSVS